MGTICIQPRSLEVIGLSAMFPLPIEKTTMLLCGAAGLNADKIRREEKAVNRMNLDDIKSLNFYYPVLV